jgi:hypothetical protein
MDRAAAQLLRTAFPSVERLRIELEFRDPARTTVGSQAHVFHPPAQAFFEFPCPYSACNGGFDLTASVTSVLEGADPRCEGALTCSGTRSRDRLANQPCGLQVDYVVTATYRAES